MEQFKYDIFISYRRKGGSEKAQLIKSELKQRGVEEERIFLDTHSLHDGDFEQKIKVAIEQSKSIVVIISNGCFDEIKETDYWYMEIKEALAEGKQIVPIFFDGITSFASMNVPEELEALTRMNAVTYQHEYANAAFDKVITFIGYENRNASQQQKKKGCLFSFKYKGCLISVTLVGLFLLVIVPMSLLQFSGSSHSGDYRYDEDLVNGSPNEGNSGKIQYGDVPIRSATPPTASPKPDSQEASSQLFGMWYGKDRISSNTIYFKFFPDVFLMEERNDSVIIKEKRGQYIIKSDSIIFYGHKIEQSAKFKLSGKELWLLFDNRERILLKRKEEYKH